MERLFVSWGGGGRPLRWNYAGQQMFWFSHRDRVLVHAEAPTRYAREMCMMCTE